MEWRWVFRAMRWIRQWLSPHTPLFGARLGLLVTLILAISGIALGIWQQSLTIQSDGIIAATDVLTSILFLAALRHSFRSPDVIHNYGYGKYESLGILLNSLFLLMALLYAGLELATGVEISQPIEQYWLLVVYSSFSMVLLFALSRIQRYYAQRYQMPLLAYDADLWRIDAYTELGVLMSLLVGYGFTQYGEVAIARWIDSIVALALLVLNIVIIVPHLRDAFNQLLDRTLPESIQLDILSVIVTHLSEICEFRQLHTRQSGRDLFMEIDVVMPFDMTLERAYRVEQQIQQEIRKRYQTAIVRLYAVPCPRDCIHDGRRFCPVQLAQPQSNNQEYAESRSSMEQQRKLST